MLKRHAELLHLLFCDRPHADDPILLTKKNLSSKCLYWLEESLAETWEQEEHAKWLALAEAVDELAKEKGQNIYSIMIKLKDYAALRYMLEDYLSIIE